MRTRVPYSGLIVTRWAVWSAPFIKEADSRSVVKVGGPIRAQRFMCRLTVEGISGTQGFDNGNICFTECVSPVCRYLTGTLIGKIARSKDGRSSNCQTVVSMIEFHSWETGSCEITASESESPSINNDTDIGRKLWRFRKRLKLSMCFTVENNLDRGVVEWISYLCKPVYS